METLKKESVNEQTVIGEDEQGRNSANELTWDAISDDMSNMKEVMKKSTLNESKLTAYIILEQRVVLFKGDW